MKKSFTPLEIRNNNRKQKFLMGFTLIELIVVIAIIAILAAIIAPNAFKAIEKAKVARAQAEAKVFKTVLSALYTDTGRWSGDEWASNPANYAGFTAIYFGPLPTTTILWSPPRLQPSDLSTNDSGWIGWDGPYLNKSYGKHPWGGTYLLIRDTLMGNGRGIYLFFAARCYGESSGYDCPMPRNIAEKFDQDFDDGNLASGNGNFFLWFADSYLWKIVSN